MQCNIGKTERILRVVVGAVHRPCNAVGFFGYGAAGNRTDRLVPAVCHFGHQHQ